VGLFAARQYEAGDIVTSYGGIRRNPTKERIADFGAHARLIPKSTYCMDGGPWVAQFDFKDESGSEPNQVNLRLDCGIELKEEILRSGVGYMANRATKCNIKVEAVHPNPNKWALPSENVLFFVATKKIMSGQEILAPNHNMWSRLDTMGFRDIGLMCFDDEDEERRQGRQWPGESR
jgi:hypothetical protein